MLYFFVIAGKPTSRLAAALPQLFVKTLGKRITMDLESKDRSNARDSAYISSAEIDNVSRGAKDSDKILRYMKGVMTFAGLYYRPLKSCPSFPLDLIFCLFTLLLMVGEFCRVSILYEATQPFSVKILRLLSHMCIAKDLVIIVLFLCSITPKLRQFSSKYHTYCLNRLSYNDSKPNINMNLKTTIFLSYVFLFLIRFFINITPSIWPELVDNYSKPYFETPDPTITRIVGVACSAFFVYYHFIETTAYVFLIVVCKVISVEFGIVTAQLKSFLKEDSSDMEEELKDHRKRYLELCRLVSTLDNVVGPLILTLCIFDMLTIVFHVTGFLDVNIVGMSSLWFRVITFLSALDRTIHLGSLIYAGVNLNAKVRAQLQILILHHLII